MPAGIDINYKAIMDQENDPCIPRFEMMPIQNMEKSEAVGHPVFEDVPFVTVYSPGNKLEIPCFRVEEKHRMRWPKQWEAFMAGEEAPMEGLPLVEWPPITRAQVETLKGFHIRTVEELASGTDENMKNIGPVFIDLSNKAAKFLENHGSEKARISELEQKNQDLMDRLEKLEAQSSPEPPKKKPGRPKKL